MRKWTIGASIMALAVATASLSACTHSNGKVSTAEPTALASVTTSAPESANPSPAAPSSAPSGSASPSPKATTGTGGTKAQKLDATAVMTIAAQDTSTGDIIVGGYVRGVIEANGTCLFTVTNVGTGSTTTATTTGIDNSDSTSCGSATIPAAKLSTGSYTVFLKYSNSTGSASSTPVDLQVSR